MNAVYFAFLFSLMGIGSSLAFGGESGKHSTGTVSPEQREQTQEITVSPGESKRYRLYGLVNISCSEKPKKDPVRCFHSFVGADYYNRFARVWVVPSNGSYDRTFRPDHAIDEDVRQTAMDYMIGLKGQKICDEIWDYKDWKEEHGLSY